jgi:hypothetical protein
LLDWSTDLDARLFYIKLRTRLVCIKVANENMRMDFALPAASHFALSWTVKLWYTACWINNDRQNGWLEMARAILIVTLP